MSRASRRHGIRASRNIRSAATALSWALCRVPGSKSQAPASPQAARRRPSAQRLSPSFDGLRATFWVTPLTAPTLSAGSILVSRPSRNPHLRQCFGAEDTTDPITGVHGNAPDRPSAQSQPARRAPRCPPGLVRPARGRLSYRHPGPREDPVAVGHDRGGGPKPRHLKA